MRPLRTIGFALLVTAASLPALGRSDKLVAQFFGSRSCGQCLEIMNEILSPLAREFPDRLSVEFHDIREPEGFELMMRMEEVYGVRETSPQELYVGDSYLTGYENISTSAKRLILEVLHDRNRWSAPDFGPYPQAQEIDLQSRFKEFTFLGIVAAALVDGVNPCAIATLIFLISFLTRRRLQRRQVLAVAMSFTGTVYFTYLLIGLGAFEAMILLGAYGWLSSVIRWTAVVLAAIVGVVSLRDAFAYARTSDTGEIALQLPRQIKFRIHRIITERLTGSHLVMGAVVTGFLVTLLEAVCTGQVYLPTIVLMTRTTGLRFTGWLYLLFYNFLFVLPLLLIMVFASYGLTWNRLSKFTQRRLPLLKILLGAVMIGLALFLALS